MFFDKKYNKLNKKIDYIANLLLKSRIESISEILQSNKKIIWKSFLSGLSKGVGIAIGFTILGAVVIYILQKIVILNIPGIGEYIYDIVEIIETNRK